MISLSGTPKSKELDSTIPLALDSREYSRRGAGGVQDPYAVVRVPLVNAQPVDMNEALKWLQDTLMDGLPESISLNMRVPVDLPVVFGDRQQLLLAFLHLASIARGAMTDGGMLSVLVSVVPGQEVRSRLPDASAEQYLYIAVVDNGEAMDDRIRKRFWTPSCDTNGSGHGTAKRLAVVRSVVRSHRGFIVVGDQPAMGTMVCVYLPALTVGFSKREPADG